jgi:hypothetical protein
MSVIWVPKCTPLFIDKLSMTLHVSDSEKMKVMADFVEVIDSFYGGKLWESKNYHRNKKVYIDDEYILFQCGPKQKGSNWFRVEYNPAKVDPAEVATLVDLVIPGGYQELIKYGRITRIDFAINVKWLKVRDLYFYYPSLSVSKISLKSGSIQSAYLGSDDGVNQFVFYDKVAEIMSKNNKLGQLYKKEVPMQPLTRVEWRYRPKLICTFDNLLKGTKNSYEKLSLCMVTDVPKVPATDYEATIRQVFELGKYVGLQQALFAVPKHQRKMVKEKILKSGLSYWWQPAILWKTLPGAIAQIVNPVMPKYWPIG